MNNPLKLAILHGSQATGKAHKNSDWDVAILAERKLDFADYSSLINYFSEKFNAPSEQIDIADLRVAYPLLQFGVAKKGILIEGSNFDFIQYKIFAWKHYLETKKFHKLREHFILGT